MLVETHFKLVHCIFFNLKIVSVENKNESLNRETAKHFQCHFEL